VTEQVPDRATIEKLLAAAVRAPTHHLTQPWRFVVLQGEARRRLGEAWAAGQPDKVPEQTIAKALRAPVIVAVIERPHLDNPKVVEIEEHMATGAALQNILLAAHALGLGAMLRTGAAAELAEVREYLRVEDDELIAGFVYIGYPDGSERPSTRRTTAEELTEWRSA
jgi:nitroreductase